jgi:hypothetical protein
MELGCDQYAALWELKFFLWFESQHNYLIVPLSSFATDNNETCEIYITSYVEPKESETSTISNTVILGSMFLQQFVAHYTYTYPDLEANDVVVDLQLSLSETYAYPGAYIGGSDLFSLTNCEADYSSDVSLPVIIEPETMSLYIDAAVGNQGN